MSTLASKAEELKSRFESEKTNIQLEMDHVEHFRIEWLGKKGFVAKLFEELRHCSKEERPEAGKSLNILRQSIESAIDSLKAEAENAAIDNLVNSQKIDITLPVAPELKSGSLHPVTLMREKILESSEDTASLFMMGRN